MKTILITGDHPRHLYFADKFVSKFEELGIKILWAIEKRESFIPIPDKDLDLQLKKLFELHFEKGLKRRNFFLEKMLVNMQKVKLKKL